MAKPVESLREILTEADLLAHSGGTLDELQRLARLALRVYRWVYEDGEAVPDDDLRIVHPSRWDRMGVKG